MAPALPHGGAMDTGPRCYRRYPLAIVVLFHAVTVSHYALGAMGIVIGYDRWSDLSLLLGTVYFATSLMGQYWLMPVLVCPGCVYRLRVALIAAELARRQALEAGKPERAAAVTREARELLGEAAVLAAGAVDVDVLPRCASGLNIVSSRRSPPADPSLFMARGSGPMCHNNHLLVALLAPLVLMVPVLWLNFSWALPALFVAVLGLLLFRMGVLFPRIACPRCEARGKCPNAQSMGSCS